MADSQFDRYEVAQQMFPDMPPGFPYEGFDIEELILPPNDDMGIKSDDEDIKEEDLQTDTGFGSCVVVTGLPIVPEAKYEKLLGVVKKLCTNDKIGKVKEDGFCMPQDEQKNSKGYCFVEYDKPEMATRCVEMLADYSLDKNHTLTAYKFDAFDVYARVPDTYAPPPEQQYKPTENVTSWMMDKIGRDQFVIKAGDDTEVLWNDGKRGRTESAYQRQFWTESFVEWSPQGTMLATMHRQGVAVWGGPSFARIARYNHPLARLIDFSPNEKYLFTYSSQGPERPDQPLQVLLNVWEVRTGKNLREFTGPVDEYAINGSAGPNGVLKWPVFKWAGGKDDLYFARLGKNAISVYQCPDMSMLDKKSYKIDNVYDFEWSPAEPVLAAYTTEAGNTPARIVLVKVPEKTEIRQKNLFSVSDIKIHWHPQGDYLAVKVERFTKTKKSTYTGFEIFRVREKDIPMEVFELKDKDGKQINEKVITFAWEPKGHRFAIVHGDGPRPSISFYTMKDEKGKPVVKHLTTLPSRPCNSIYWSPQGKNIVIAGLKNLNGQLEFFNVDELETMNTAEHFMATDVEWDPTGRYVATTVTSVHQMENGFMMWSFAGKQLLSQNRDRMSQFAWRPRLPSQLPPEKEAEIVKNLKTYTKRYEEEDEALLMQADADVLQERQKLQDEWKAFLERKRNYREMVEAFCREVYGPRFAEREFTVQKVAVEQVLDVKEEPYKSA